MKKKSMDKENVNRDIQLVREFLNGDDGAFTKLFNRYSEGLKFNFLKRTSSMDIAKDLLMEVFTKAFTNIRSFNPETGAFSTWLYRIASNHYIDYLRKVTNHNLMRIDDMKVEAEDGVYGFQLESGDANPEKVVEKQQRKEFAKDLIDSINNDFSKKIVKMRFIDEMSYDEISAITDTPLGTIKGTIFRAKNEMKKKGSNIKSF